MTTSWHENRASQPVRRLSVTARHRRSASVLVLVMTLLSILFVLGVAFLATMNFEAERVAAEAQQQRTQLGAEVLIDDLGAVIRAGLMADTEQPFAGNDTAGSLTGFTQLPGWHNTYSPVEPYTKSDGRVVWPWFVDLASSNETQGVCIGGTPAAAGPACTSDFDCGGWRCEELFVCEGGPRSGEVCLPSLDCPGEFCKADLTCHLRDFYGNIKNCSPELECPAGVCARAGFGGARWRGAELDTTWDAGAEGTEELPGSSTPTRKASGNTATSGSQFKIG